MPSEGFLAPEKHMKKQRFSICFSRFLITLQKCIRRRFATDLGGPKLSFGASFGCSKPPMDSNLEAQSLPRTPTWTPKALPDPQVGHQNALPEPQHGCPKRSKTSTWRRKGCPRLHFGGPKHSNSLTRRSPALQLGPFGSQNSLPKSKTSKNLTSDD